MHTNPDLLHYFELTDDDFLGAGSESAVYSLNTSQIIRFYGNGDAFHKVTTLKFFYDQLAKVHLPFQVPHILSFDDINGRFYSIETKLPGQTLTHIVPNLDAEQRQRALQKFIQTSALLKTIPYPQAEFGEILTQEPIRANSWDRFLIKRIEQTLSEAYPIISQDVPQIDALFSQWQTLLPLLGSIQPKLVHGDYYWGMKWMRWSAFIDFIMPFTTHLPLILIHFCANGVWLSSIALKMKC